MKKKTAGQMPSVAQMQAELSRLKYRNRFSKVMRSTVYALIIVAAIAVLVATLWMPVLQIHGSSMAPNVADGDIILTVKTSEAKPGEIIAFYYNNKILVKRVIALPGDWVDISEDGSVYVNSVLQEETYLQEKALGQCDIEFPYQVPAASYFVLGDNRSVSVDSRHSAVGCISEEQIVGKIVFRVWPLPVFGLVE